MGYHEEGDLEDLFRPDTASRCARRITERVGERLQLRVKEFTPLALPPPNVSAGEWIRSRGGRVPGHLRDSWRVSSVDRVRFDLHGEEYEVEVYTLDPIAPHVEYPTQPHVITPRDPDGWLRWWDRRTGQIRFARIVHHPGTHGTYMMQRALAALRVEWHVIAREEVAEWARTYWRR